MSSLRKARRVLIIAAVITAVNQSLCAFLGLLCLHHYHGPDSDPSDAPPDGEQVILCFVRRTLSQPEDLVGLFLGGLMSGTLSTVSTCLHSAATVVWEECAVHFIERNRSVDSLRLFDDGQKALDQMRKNSGIVAWQESSAGAEDDSQAQFNVGAAAAEPNSENAAHTAPSSHEHGETMRNTFLKYLDESFERHSLLWGRALVLLIGVVGTGLAFTVDRIGGTLDVGSKGMGIFGGLIVGLFTLGLFFGGRVLHIGALAGLAAGAVASMTLLGFSFAYRPFRHHRLNTSHPSPPYSPQLNLHYGDPNSPLLARAPKYMQNVVAFAVVVTVGLAVSELLRWLRPAAAAEEDQRLRRKEAEFREAVRGSTTGVDAFEPTKAIQPLIRFPELKLPSSFRTLWPRSLRLVAPSPPSIPLQHVPPEASTSIDSSSDSQQRRAPPSEPSDPVGADLPAIDRAIEVHRF